MPLNKREDTMRQETYKPPSELDIPEIVVRKFLKDGYHLRWIRAQIYNEDDARNIAYRKREGYEFVQKVELPEGYEEYFDTRKVRNHNSVICVGDLILGKIDIAKAKARQKFYEESSSERVKAARNEAKEADDIRIKTMVPIIDESESEVQFVKEKRRNEEES